MKLLDIVMGPWAIQPEKLSEIQAIYSRHLRGEKLDWKTMAASLGKPDTRGSSDYYVLGDVAVVPIEGALAKKANIFMQICGGASYQLVEQQFRAALADPNAKAVILDIDSPGGSVDGVQELANAIFDARGSKPIVALANGLMASAAYYLGSAADSVYMASNMTTVGSIGVVAQHMDVSGQESQRGVRTTEITAGKYKRIASQFGPLSAEGRATIQDQVDQMYSTFVQDVAKFRGVSVETVLEEMADGRVFIGRQALDAGLVDGVATLDRLVEMLSEGTIPAGRAAVSAATQTNKEGTMPLQTFGATGSKAEDSEIEKKDGQKAAETPASGADSKKDEEEEGNAKGGEKPGDDKNDDEPDDDEDDKSSKKGKTSAATVERERIQAVLSLSRPGHEAFIHKLAFDGTTTKAEAAEALLSRIDAKNKARLTAMTEDAPAPVVTGFSGESNQTFNPAAVGDKIQKVVAEHKAKGVTLTAEEAFKMVTSQNHGA